MKQKVALIAALSHNPKVLIMDEPFIGICILGMYLKILMPMYHLMETM